MKIHHYAYPALLATALALPSVTMAQTETANLTVSININAACTLNAATLAFTDQTGLNINANVEDTASVTVNCTNTADYQLGFGPGQNNQGGRRMTDGSGNFITYDIFRNAAHTESLTEIGGGIVITGTGTGTDQTRTVYGRILPQTATKVGAYTDQVLMTLQY